MKYKKEIEKEIQQAQDLFRSLTLEKYTQPIEKTVDLILKALKNGKKILIFGNGGSAADSQHFAAELAVRFEKKRKPFSAAALTTDTSNLTACSNDYGFDYVFSKQIEALGKKGDIAIALTTSGASANVIKALQTAKNKDLNTVLLCGKLQALKIKKYSDIIIEINEARTCRVQEAHALIYHIICFLVEKKYG